VFDCSGSGEDAGGGEGGNEEGDAEEVVTVAVGYVDGC
jgi:hypothetical protein